MLSKLRKNRNLIPESHSSKQSIKRGTTENNKKHTTDDDDTDSESDSYLDNLASRVATQIVQHMENDTDTSDSSDSSDTNDKDFGFVIDKSGLKNSKGAKIESNKEKTCNEASFTKLEKSSERQRKVGSSASDISSSESELEHDGKRKSHNEGDKKKASIREVGKLASSLDPGLSIDDISYINTNPLKKPNVYNQKIEALLLKPTRDTELMKKSVLTCDFEKKESLPPYQQGLHQMRKQRKEERNKTKGKGWFDMRAPEMTEERKNDLMVLQMRRSLDPKRFYKGPDIRGTSKFFQTGRVVETAADFYSGRIPMKQRKKTLVDELLADAEFRKYNKRKYMEIQETSKSWKGAHKHMKRLKKKKK